MARKRRRKKSRQQNFTYGRNFAGHQKEKKSLIWTDGERTRKDSLL